MARCHPFPPPGYVKTISIEEADPLKEVQGKHEEPKEEQQGKDRMDKETSKQKHRRDKERNKDKSLTSKEKKERHKHRRDKDRNKEKSRSLEEKKKRDKHKNREKDKSRTSEEKKATDVLTNTEDKEKLVMNTLQDDAKKNSKLVQGLARRNKDEEEATQSQSPQKINISIENNISFPVLQTNHMKDGDKRINIDRKFPKTKESKNLVPRVASRKGVEVKKTVLLQVKTYCRKNVLKSDKPLDIEVIKKSDLKKKKEEKTEVMNKAGQERPTFVEGRPKLKEWEQKSEDTKSTRVQDLSRASVKSLPGDEVLGKRKDLVGKRKDLETNGLLNEKGSSKPKKMQKSAALASPLSSIENRRKLGACKTPSKLVSELEGTVCKPEINEQRINGFIDSQVPKSRSDVLSVKEKSEAFTVKQPHSDLKADGEQNQSVASPLSSVENRRKLGACQTSSKPVTEMQGTSCKPKVKEQRINGFIDSQVPKSRSHVSSVKMKEKREASAVKRPHSDLKPSGEEILCKREDLETNEHGSSRPNKIPMSVASPIPSVENRRKLRACQAPSKPVTELQETVSNPEVKEDRINGFIDPTKSKSRSHVSSKKAKEKKESSAKKRPHPDLEYLDQILLNVPKREELQVVDDDDDDEQEWLFDQSGANTSKKQITDCTTSLDEIPQVWNKAMRIESADIIALPYVLPF